MTEQYDKSGWLPRPQSITISGRGYVFTKDDQPHVDEAGNVFFRGHLIAKVAPNSNLQVLRGTNTPAQQEIIDNLNRRLRDDRA